MKPAPWGLLMRNPPPWRWVGDDKEIGLVEAALEATVSEARPLQGCITTYFLSILIPNLRIKYIP